MKQETESSIKALSENVSYSFKELLEFELFSLGKYTLSVYEILGAIFIVVLGWLASKVVKSFIYKSEKLEISKKFAFSKIIYYIIVVITFFMVMRTLGVNISPILLGSGAILVGIGLGLQNLFLDFISGIIILIDRTVKVGDVVEISGIIGKVEEIQMRTTTILTRDNKHMIFPNSLLTKDKIINFSHGNDIVRFEIKVGISYDSDVDLAEKILKQVVEEHKEIVTSDQYKTIVRLENFGDSSLDLLMLYHSRNLFRQPIIRSELRREILKKFRENNITIPFPTRTLDFPKQNENNNLPI